MLERFHKDRFPSDDEEYLAIRNKPDDMEGAIDFLKGFGLLELDWTVHTDRYMFRRHVEAVRAVDVDRIGAIVGYWDLQADRQDAHSGKKTTFSCQYSKSG